MNEQQQEIIQTFGIGQAVIAGAGCGKTTTLVAKCVELVRQNPDARFCAVSFTEKSVRDLKESLKKGFLKAGYDTRFVQEMSRKHWVKTIHGLCLSIVQEFPLEAGLHGGERIIMQEETDRLWQRSLYLLWTRSENAEISEATARLLDRYSRKMLEANFKQLRSLISFGVAEHIEKLIPQRSELGDLWLLFQSVNDRFQQWKLKSGALDFNDLERFARTALTQDQVRQHYHERFDLVMVDEFQDTNPIQGEILESIVKTGFSNLLIVGDPKQSIYRFRDADVSVFQDLALKLPKRRPLDMNYRSSPLIIDFVNRVCAPLFAASDLDYEALRPGRTQEDYPEDRVLRLILDDEDSLARFLKSKEQQGIDLSEYVILARSVRKDKTQQFLNALDERNIPYLLGSGGRFYSDPRVLELIAFLKGWCSSNHTQSQVTALRAPWIGIADQQLLDWRGSGYFQSFFTESDHPIARALKDAFLNRHPLRPGEVLERIWETMEEGSEMELPIATLWQKVEDLSARGNRFEEAINELVKAIEEDRIEKEVPPPAEKGMVRIMTVHASKGLQFPRVILLDFDGEHRPPNSSSDFIWNRKEGIHLQFRDETGSRDKKNEENIRWNEIEKSAAVAESKRLFYVAITRPQEQLILAWKREIKESSKDPSLKLDDWRTWITLTVGDSVPAVEAPTEVAANHPISAVATESSVAPRSKTLLDPDSFRPRHSPSEWLILNQCPLRYQKKFYSPDWAEEKQFLDAQELEEEAENNNSESDIASIVAEKGKRIHQHLEFEDFESLSSEFKSASTGNQVADQMRSLLWGDADHPSQRVLDGWSIHPEIAFEVPFLDHSHADEAMVGMMDRLEVNRATGTIRVLDYKWTQAKKTPDQLRAHYQLQLELYAWAAMRLCGPDFQFRKLETKLIHLSEDGATVIDVPIRAENLNDRVLGLLQQSRTILKNESLKLTETPREGDYCRYCEFKRQCPAKQ
jgi:ATP-dependent exoDNAse (exonuclease V) beta subunit